MSLTSLLEEYHHTKAEAKVWKKAGADGGTHDRGLSLGASEAFICLRRAAYLKHPEWDVQVDPQYWGYANRGHQVEAFVTAAIRESLESGEKLLYAGRSQRTFVHPLLPISATPDGLYVPNKEDRVYLEIKSVDPRTSPHKLPKDEHVLQAKSGMEILATVDPARAPTRGVLLYVDSSSLRVVKEIPLERDAGTMEAHARRARQAFEAKNPLEVQAEGVFDRQCRHCPYKKVCQPYAAMPGVPQAPVDVAMQVAPLAERFLELKQAEEELEEVKAQIKTILVQANADTVAGEGWAAKLSRSEGRKTFDRAKIEALCARTQTPVSTLEKLGAGSISLTVSVA